MWGVQRCKHEKWEPTPSRALERCVECKVLRHKTFVGPDGKARSHTHTATVEGR